MKFKLKNRLKHLGALFFICSSMFAIYIVFDSSSKIYSESENSPEETEQRSQKYKLHFFKPI